MNNPRNMHLPETYKEDCFSFGRRKGGRVVCNALKDIVCKDCIFYKTAEQVSVERVKANEKNKQNGIENKYKIIE